MKKRLAGIAVWLVLTACLCFFENNTGTRIVFLCSLLVLLIPPLRSALLSADESGKQEKPVSRTVDAFSFREPEESGDVRSYRPGDPVRRIHWKLSAKKDEWLVRETAAEEAAEQKAVSPANRRKPFAGKWPAMALVVGAAACVLMLLLIPEANHGLQALCNRVFAASEAVNAYAYRYFPVAEDQNLLPAAGILLCLAGILLALTLLLRSRLLALGLITAATAFQMYFGLPFPAWINVPLYSLAGLWMMKRPAGRKSQAVFCLSVLLVSLSVTLLFPGVNAATEEASETVRDYLSRTVQQITGIEPERPDGETETRHLHTRTLVSGEREARTDREFRLVTVEEEQISIPHWINWMKMVLFSLLAVALLILPFTPFLLLNARRRKAQEIRAVFASDDVSAACQAIFQRIILWLETTGFGAGNDLYRDWSGQLPDSLPEGYRLRFAQCAADFEEAAYSTHEMAEEKRQAALDLLKETEAELWKTADRKQRFLLKYWMCIYE